MNIKSWAKDVSISQANCLKLSDHKQQKALIQDSRGADSWNSPLLLFLANHNFFKQIQTFLVFALNHICLNNFFLPRNTKKKNIHKCLAPHSDVPDSQRRKKSYMNQYKFLKHSKQNLELIQLKVSNTTSARNVNILTSKY